MTDITEAEHLAHCNQGEYQGFCKFDPGEDCVAFWDPWDELKVHVGGYSSRVDQEGLAVLRGIRDKLFNGDIAKLTGMTESHVELWQYIFCSAGWAEYGTSPRGCFPTFRKDINELIRKWENYYRVSWGQEPNA